jgi:sugar lactone lactonase YvrE
MKQAPSGEGACRMVGVNYFDAGELYMKLTPRLTAMALSILLVVPSVPAVLAAPAGLAAAPAERTTGQLEHVFSFYDAMPTGTTVTETGRIFVNFPRWGDDVPFTVAEIRNGKLVAYPDLQVNKANLDDPAGSFISVQSVVADGRGHLWVLDTAAPGFATPHPGGAKLVAIDLKTNRIVKTVVFPANVILPTTYVNDVRFDFRLGKEGVAYVTDSSQNGPGGIIVLDLATGRGERKLSGERSTAPDPAFAPVVEGRNLRVRSADGKTSPFSVASDGIALSPDGSTLYYSALSSRHLFAVSTALLHDPDLTGAMLSAAVRDLGEKGASDGLEADASGAVYASDYEHNSIKKRLPDGSWATLAHDPRMLWPDTLSIGPDGYLYFIANQLQRQAVFNAGKDLRQKPYGLFRVKIDAAAAPTR